MTGSNVLNSRSNAVGSFEHEVANGDPQILTSASGTKLDVRVVRFFSEFFSRDDVQPPDLDHLLNGSFPSVPHKGLFCVLWAMMKYRPARDTLALHWPKAAQQLDVLALQQILQKAFPNNFGLNTPSLSLFR